MAQRRITNGGEAGVTSDGVVIAPSPATTDTMAPSHDKGHATEHNTLAYCIMVLQGFGLLLPWNVVLNAIPYFQGLYPGSPVAFWMTTAYIVPQLPTLFLMTAYGHRVSFTVRIVTSLVLQITQLLLLAPLAPFGVGATLAIVASNGVTSAVLQASVFGFASMFPPAFNQGLMFGNGIAGVTACAANLVVLLALPGRDSLAAYIYFCASAV